MDRRALNGLLRAYGPHLLLVGGFLKAIGVAALAPLVGAPMWMALTAAALWVAGPAAAAWFLRTKLGWARPARAASPGRDAPEGAA